MLEMRNSSSLPPSFPPSLAIILTPPACIRRRATKTISRPLITPQPPQLLSLSPSSTLPRRISPPRMQRGCGMFVGIVSWFFRLIGNRFHSGKSNNYWKMTNRNGVLVRSNILRRNGTVTPIHFTNRNAVPVRSGPFRALLNSLVILVFNYETVSFQLWNWQDNLNKLKYIKTLKLVAGLFLAPSLVLVPSFANLATLH